MADKHQPDSSNSVQISIRHKQGMPMQSQFEQAILDVYDFCIKEKEAGVPIIPLNHFSKRVCELLKISDSSVKRVLRKRENGEPLAPIKRTRNRKSPITNIDDYTRDAIARKVHAYNYQGENEHDGQHLFYFTDVLHLAHFTCQIPSVPPLDLDLDLVCIPIRKHFHTDATLIQWGNSLLDKHFTMAALLEECKTDLGFKGCEKSLRAILQKQLGFVFKKVDNKLKLEQKKVIKKRTRSPKQQPHQNQQQQKCPKKTKKGKQSSVPVQTQTMQTGTVPEMTMAHADHMAAATMHTGVEYKTAGIEEIQMRHQGHQTETIEHMALTGLVAHRANVIENMAMAHRANEMAMQQQQQQQQQQQHHRQHPMEGMTTVINEYRKQ